jgi:hypothetical protein
MPGDFFIDFGPSISDDHIESYFAKNSLDESIFQTSFKSDVTNVLFDFTLTEWVTAEQITFLFAWIRNVKLSGKKITVRLPYRSNLINLVKSGKIGKQEMERLTGKYSDQKGGYIDSQTRIERRLRCNAFLMAVYGLYDRVGLDLYDFENMADNVTYNLESRRLEENFHQVIPFTYLDISAPYDTKYDLSFQDVIALRGKKNANGFPIFQLQKEIQELLKKYACYSPFESKILSNVITQELYVNAMEHSKRRNDVNLQTRECYITAFLSNKWESTDNQYFNKRFLNEKRTEELDFYKDKIQIQKLLPTTQDIRFRPGTREVDLLNFPVFRNISYLEFSFLDLGIGIPESLGDQMRYSEQEHPGKLELMSTQFDSVNTDAKVIEYAMMMDTSSAPIDQRIQYYELVPRGLYFLVDMVRRYKGLLTIRSGRARVTFDFSDRLYISERSHMNVVELRAIKQIRDAVRHENHNYASFPGTHYSIVLPEMISSAENKETQQPVRPDDERLNTYAYGLRANQFLSPHPKEEFSTGRFEYIGILFLYNAIVEELSKDNGTINNALIYNKLFAAVNNALDALSGANCIIFFDFSGLKTGTASWIKILYYLINTPKINEYTKAIIVNLPPDENNILQTIRENKFVRTDTLSKEVHAFPEPFLYKAIPCIQFRIDISEKENIKWIGLKSHDDESLLTELLLGEKETVSTSRLRYPGNTESNLFVKADLRIYPTYHGYDQIQMRFEEAQRRSIAKFLKKYVANGGEYPDNIQMVFLPSRGGYQVKYLSLYEVLHDKYVARFFAKCLLERYAFHCRKIANQKAYDYAKFRFSKIIAVTVSSQLLGIAIRDLIEQDDTFAFLRTPAIPERGSDSAPDLVMLSNYFSFESEKPFEKITGGDNVLLVNDVISTGSLVGKLIDILEGKKNAIVKAIFSIADCRVAATGEDEMECHFFPGHEEVWFTLNNESDGLQIKRYRTTYTGDAVQKRINPLLNTIVELKAVHGEQRKILFADPAQLINDPNIDARYFKIGHFQQNLTHNGYMTNMRPLFASTAGPYIITRVKDKIQELYYGDISDKKSDYARVKIASMNHQLRMLKDAIGDEKNEGAFQQIRTGFLHLMQNISLGQYNSEEDLFKPDFIFYPVFSGMEKVSHFELSRIFHTHPDNIIGLQRFDTPKGWRFPFPAKRFNRLTFKKKVMIIDSGSLTGESLVQLIDNIGFLDVSEIVVVSIINRVEDFFREFYSRLTSLRVKKLKSSADDVENNLVEPMHTVPISVIFGLNLHIPVYSSSVSCPFCEESTYLRQIIESDKHSLTTEVKNYIAFRRNEIASLSSVKDTLCDISYLPTLRTLKNTLTVDTKGIFLMRDMLGKIDSYRFYPDYFDEFNKLVRDINASSSWYDQPLIQQRIERVFICILHESHLVEIVKNYLNSLLPFMYEYLDRKFLHTTADPETLYYQWNAYTLTQLTFILRKELIYDLTVFERLLSYKDIRAKRYLHFKFWEILYYSPKYEADKERVQQLLRSFNDQYGSKAHEYPTIYSDANREFCMLLTNQIHIKGLSNYEFLDAPFQNLSNFVYISESKGRHFELVENLNKLFTAVESPRQRITNIREKLLKVFDVFNRNLRPSIEKITQDAHIRSFFSSFNIILGANPDGFLYHMNALQSLFDTIKEISQEEISNYLTQLKAISHTCDKLVNEVLKESLETECFYKISKDYPTNAVAEITELKERYAGKVPIEIDEFISSIKMKEICCQKTIFNTILDELADNALRVYPNDLKVTFSIKELDSERLQIVFKQNKPFQPSMREGIGGRSQIVEYFTQKFRGEYKEEKFEGDADFRYVVILVFPIYKFFPEEQASTSDLNSLYNTQPFAE